MRYWQGKKRDKNTIEALSESKFKSCYTYDLNGNFIKKYKSYKECANDLFGDYEIKNGSGNSKIYTIIRNKNPKNRIYNNIYIFKEDFIFNKYNKIPNKIDLEKIFIDYNKSIPPKKNIRKTKRVYEINSEYNNKIKKFENIKKCAKYYKISTSSVRRRINNKVKDIVKFYYGEKKVVDINKK
jgi:hypothetical protein